MLTPRSRALLNASFSALMLPKSAEPAPAPAPAPKPAPATPAAELPSGLEDAAPLTSGQQVPLNDLPNDPGDEGVAPRLG